MTVEELIEQLKKVEDEEALVYLNDDEEIRTQLRRVTLVRDLADDEFVVVLKK